VANLKKEKKEITKRLKEVVDDLMDNYEKYDDSEKNKVKNQMQSMILLNKSLDKYDPWITKLFDAIMKAFNDFFGKN
jgi:DNA-directed RNA polymerase specialized sigma54-like protein